ncbi:MAG TPA: MlaD family protein [Terriglobia bacterium]|nr:MlaD family protein [Terriglobia bacterium]
MNSRHTRSEQVWVGLFVLIAAGLLIAAVLAVKGVFSGGNIPHRAFFKFAAGLQPGAAVRFGGMNAGSVQAVHIDPEDSTRIEVDFNVGEDIPLKTDSMAKITSLSPLGDNYLELSTGSRRAPKAPPGSVIKSAPSFNFNDLAETIAGLQPLVQQTLEKLDQRLDELQVTVARANDLLSDKNRSTISASLGEVHSMLAEDRPKVSATLDNVQTASAQFKPLLDNLKRTMASANDAMDHINATVLENRKDLRASVQQLRETLLSASSVMEQLNHTLNYNSDNIDEIMANVRVATQELKDLTEKLERQPYTLIRADRAKERKPGGK